MNASAGESSFLDRLYTAAPCNVPWDDMTGTERVRDCSQCSRQVFNISDMTKADAEAFLKGNGDSQCLAYYRRKDGTIMTDDCPIGLRKIRNTLRGLRRAAGFLISTLFSVGAAFAQKADPTVMSSKEKVGYDGPRRTLGKVLVRDTVKYTVPAIAELKSGNHALGEELSMRGDSLFLNISEMPPQGRAGLDYSPELTAQQQIPCDLSPRDAYAKGTIYETMQMPKAAENFYKLALKLFQANENKVPTLQTSIAVSYRNLLLKEKRIEEARDIETEFNIPKQ